MLVKLDQEMLALIDRDIRKPGRTEEGIAEKDPTVYLFRRNLGTHLYLLGLEDNEIQYILGHEIEDENDERNFFRNEEKLYPIAKKMALRPLVNPTIAQSDTDVEADYLVRENCFNEKFNLRITKPTHIKLIAQQREPFSSLSISIKKEASLTLAGEYLVSPNDQDNYGNTLNITTDYIGRYLKSIGSSNE